MENDGKINFVAEGLEGHNKNVNEFDTSGYVNPTSSDVISASDSNAITWIDNFEKENISFEGNLGKYTYKELINQIQ